MIKNFKNYRREFQLKNTDKKAKRILMQFTEQHTSKCFHGLKNKQKKMKVKNPI